jgi:hypothetical protein
MMPQAHPPPLKIADTGSFHQEEAIPQGARNDPTRTTPHGGRTSINNHEESLDRHEEQLAKSLQGESWSHMPRQPLSRATKVVLQPPHHVSWFSFT